MVKFKCDNPEEVVKEAFFLAYQACGGTFGLGFLQAVSNATKEDVWANVRTRGDYPTGAAELTKASKPGEAYGDYVFGRMMKLNLRWDSESVEISDEKPRGDYQAWCRKYPSYRELIEAAVASLKS